MAKIPTTISVRGTPKCSHAFQRRGDKSVIPVVVIEDADREHQYCAWKADADDCGDGAYHATQLFPDQDRHVGRIQTGRALAIDSISANSLSSIQCRFVT